MTFIPAQSGGAVVILYDQTLLVDTAIIDSVLGVPFPATYNVLEAWFLTRTDDAGIAVGININVNNDAGANYDTQPLTADNVTVGAGAVVAQTKWAINSHGSGGGVSYAGIARLTIPSYAQTTFFKAGEITNSVSDQTVGNNHVENRGVGWRSVAAITRMSVAAQAAAKLKAGSRMLILAR